MPSPPPGDDLFVMIGDSLTPGRNLDSGRDPVLDADVPGASQWVLGVSQGDINQIRTDVTPIWFFDSDNNAWVSPLESVVRRWQILTSSWNRGTTSVGPGRGGTVLLLENEANDWDPNPATLGNFLTGATTKYNAAYNAVRAIKPYSRPAAAIICLNSNGNSPVYTSTDNRNAWIGLVDHIRANWLGFTVETPIVLCGPAKLAADSVRADIAYAATQRPICYNVNPPLVVGPPDDDFLHPGRAANRTWGTNIADAVYAAPQPTVVEDFTIPATINAPINTPCDSPVVVPMVGEGVAVTASIVGGTFSVNGGASDATNKTVYWGDEIIVTKTSSGSYSTSVSATLTLGTKSAPFTITTVAADTTPTLGLTYFFTDYTGVALNSTRFYTYVVDGLSPSYPVTATIDGGTFTVNGAGAFTSTTVVQGDVIVFPLVASASYSTPVSKMLTVGSGYDIATVTTLAPVPITWTPETPPAIQNPVFAANPVTFTGINFGVGLGVVMVSMNGRTETSVTLSTGETGTRRAESASSTTQPHASIWTFPITSAGVRNVIVTGGNNQANVAIYTGTLTNAQPTPVATAVIAFGFGNRNAGSLTVNPSGYGLAMFTSGTNAAVTWGAGGTEESDAGSSTSPGMRTSSAHFTATSTVLVNTADGAIAAVSWDAVLPPVEAAAAITQAAETAGGAGVLSIAGSGGAVQSAETAGGAGALVPNTAAATIAQAPQTAGGIGVQVVGVASIVQAAQTAGGAGQQPQPNSASAAVAQTAQTAGGVGTTPEPMQISACNMFHSECETCSPGCEDGWHKLPAERLLVGCDWSARLATGEGIATANVPEPVVPEGLTLDFVAVVGNVTQYWLAGGMTGRNDVVISVTSSNGSIIQAGIPVFLP